MFGILNLYGDRTQLNQYYSILKLLFLFRFGFGFLLLSIGSRCLNRFADLG